LFNIEEAIMLIEQLRPEMTWVEVAKELNARFGLNYNESTYRKAYNSYFSESRRKIAFERQYLRYERSKNFENIRDLTLKSMFTDELKEAIAKTSISICKRPTEVRGEDEYVFATGDLHYNGDENLLEHFNAVYTHILNKQIEHKFTRIKLIELGDIIDGGALRNSQLMALKKGMVFQVIDVSKAYANLIQKLSEKMFVEFYCVTSSNHTQLRPLGTKQNELVEEDLMQVFATYVELALQNNQMVTVRYADDLIIPITRNHNMFVAHGHLLGKHKEGYLQEVAFARSMNVHYGLFGHYHHYREITLYSGGDHNRKVFYAPALTTTESSYERDRNMSSKAGMLMMVFNVARGHRYCEELFI
jgi:hypothetical protein